jgi:hypothetical protein
MCWLAITNLDSSVIYHCVCQISLFLAFSRRNANYFACFFWIATTRINYLYLIAHNSKETGEIFRISPRKSARGIRPYYPTHLFILLIAKTKFFLAKPNLSWLRMYNFISCGMFRISPRKKRSWNQAIRHVQFWTCKYTN